MTRTSLGLILLASALLAQACSTGDTPTGKELRKVTIRVAGMAEHNGVL
jgi:hypothetical protein